jgi:acetate kinase
MTCILVVNSGSSSLKYELVEVESATVLTAGAIERIGEPLSTLSSVTDHTRTEHEREVADHEVAFAAMVGMLNEAELDLGAHPIAAVGHRVVHGGDLFFEPVIVDGAVIAAIDELSALAPLHNPANLAGILAAREEFPDIPHVAVFDTAFHQTMPQQAYTYAIDRDIAEAHSVRRYGFHGTSHESASRAAATHLDRPLSELKQIILHLGNGASMAAIDGGRSIDTSMGMSPLAGLVMGTRSGDIDPSVLSHLNREAGLSVAELDRLLNKNSGMLGLTGHTDMRDVQRAADSGDHAAQLGLDVYVHRIRHYLGAYLLELGGADVIVFTAGVGEHQAEIRAAVLDGLEWLGIELDAELNASRASTIRTISASSSRVAVLVVPADEEQEIARKVLALL